MSRKNVIEKAKKILKEIHNIDTLCIDTLPTDLEFSENSAGTYIEDIVNDTIYHERKFE